MSVTKAYQDSSEQREQFLGRSLLRIGGLLVLLYLAFAHLLN